MPIYEFVDIYKRLFRNIKRKGGFARLPDDDYFKLSLPEVLERLERSDDRSSWTKEEMWFGYKEGSKKWAEPLKLVQQYCFERERLFKTKAWGDTGGEGAGHSLGALLTRMDWYSCQLKEHVYDMVAETVQLLSVARMSASRADVIEFGRRIFNMLTPDNKAICFKIDGYTIHMELSSFVADNHYAEFFLGVRGSGNSGESHICIRQPVKRKHIRDLDIVALATAPHRTLKDVANRVREGNDGIDMYTEISKLTCERLTTIAAARLSSSDFTALKARLALLRTKKMKKALLKRTVDDLLEGVVCLPGHIAGDMGKFDNMLFGKMAADPELMHPVGHMIKMLVLVGVLVCKTWKKRMRREKRLETLPAHENIYELFDAQLDKHRLFTRLWCKISIREWRRLLAVESEVFAMFSLECPMLVEAAKELGVIVSHLYAHPWKRNPASCSTTMAFTGVWAWRLQQLRSYVENACKTDKITIGTFLGRHYFAIIEQAFQYQRRATRANLAEREEEFLSSYARFLRIAGSDAERFVRAADLKQVADLAKLATGRLHWKHFATEISRLHNVCRMNSFDVHELPVEYVASVHYVTNQLIYNFTSELQGWTGQEPGHLYTTGVQTTVKVAGKWRDIMSVKVGQRRVCVRVQAACVYV